MHGRDRAAQEDAASNECHRSQDRQRPAQPAGDRPLGVPVVAGEQRDQPAGRAHQRQRADTAGRAGIDARLHAGDHGASVPHRPTAASQSPPGSLAGNSAARRPLPPSVIWLPGTLRLITAVLTRNPTSVLPHCQGGGKILQHTFLHHSCDELPRAIKSAPNPTHVNRRPPVTTSSRAPNHRS